ncbi:Cof subfamily protein (haloacid dehalogenase superfamily) [Weissella uvarum]|uniref:Cof-type HAD-IIB family hydrolase n=1 Tax=Weissella uvarum TaxID=1479233 RepID=UPI0019612F5B|nr:Cof-type HAD-IIB family hydrolase [Weissella uvarum]MBM7617713.1 Cof subfamily protein (haloacid dehalogenase superfamily) [Weissella uvarum]MCM0596062.1 HAD family hydrolase [Weissella uvarum]
MTIKLIATDMDGTLLTDEKTYDQAWLSALLDEMAAKDIRFVAASGNQQVKLSAYFEPIGADRLTYISDNGAIVSQNNQILAEKTLRPQQVAEILKWNAKEHPIDENLVMLSGAKGAYVSNHATPEIIEMSKFFFPNIHQVDRFMDIEDDIFRVSLIWEQSVDVMPEIAELQDAFGSQLHITGSGYGSVDILAPGVNKRAGLELLSERWKINPDEMVAFGDNDNDLEMLHYVKHPFVMPNAEQFMQDQIATKAVADNNHQGVLATIQQILDGKLI